MRYKIYIMNLLYETILFNNFIYMIMYKSLNYSIYYNNIILLQL